VGNSLDLLLETIRHKRGSLELGMYKLEEAMEKPCSDLLVVHHIKCTHGRMDSLVAER
jgi:hypothetical protein